MLPKTVLFYINDYPLYKYLKKENFNYISQHVVNKLNKFAPGKAFGYNHELFLTGF